VLVNDDSGTLPVVHQEASGWRDADAECQCEFIGVLNVTFNESLTNIEVGNTQASLIYTSLNIMFKIHSTSSCHNKFFRDGPRLYGMGALVCIFPSAIHLSMVLGTRCSARYATFSS
jgi:hypothetical protein